MDNLLLYTNKLAPIIMLIVILFFLYFWKTLGIPPWLKNFIKFTIKIAPLILLPVFFLSLYYSGTRDITLWLLKENYPVEKATFIFLFLGGILGVVLSINMKKNGEKNIICIFYMCFSLLLLFTAMEEVAWGQLIFHYETPSFFKTINFQQEATLHNIKGLQHHSEILRFIFGFGGLLGLWLSRFPNWRILAPNKILLTWFIVISLHAGIDVYNDYFPIEEIFNFNLSRTAELIEMMIGFSGLLYIVLNSQWIFRYMERDRD